MCSESSSIDAWLDEEMCFEGVELRRDQLLKNGIWEFVKKNLKEKLQLAASGSLLSDITLMGKLRDIKSDWLLRGYTDLRY